VTAKPPDLRTELGAKNETPRSVRVDGDPRPTGPDGRGRGFRARAGMAITRYEHGGRPTSDHFLRKGADKNTMAHSEPDFHKVRL